MTFKVLFSDIDGTCVHYEDEDPWQLVETDDTHPAGIKSVKFQSQETPTDALLLPPSTSGSRGVISAKTIRMYDSIRKSGVKVVLISGCRYSTLLQRLPFLPAADAYVCESGGRIFYPGTDNDDSLPTAFPLLEDTEWRMRQSAAGHPRLENIPHEQKTDAPLWQQYKILHKSGLVLDAKNYSTAFRVKIKRDVWQREFAPSLVPGLAFAENLGSVDIYPETSGKKNAAWYLMNRFGADKTGMDSVFMCDDDNDIQLATAVSKAFLPSITSESMRKTVESMPTQFVVAGKKTVFATEEILQILIDKIDNVQS